MVQKDLHPAGLSWWLFMALVWLLSVAWQVPAQAQQDQPATLQVYVRAGCPHCADAKQFLATLMQQRPELKVLYRSVDTDAIARTELLDVSRAHNVWPPGVPTFVMNGRILVGFGSVEESGPILLAFIDEARIPAETLSLPLIGELGVARIGLPLFTLALGLLDGFNPCATWVLLFLLSFLVHLRDRLRIALVAGTFVLVSGLVYYAFMAAWLNVFLVAGMSDSLRVGLAVLALMIGAVNVKDFIAFGKGVSLSIPEAAKPGLYARMRSVIRAEALSSSLLAVAMLAVVVNFIELLCTAGLPAIYTAVLTQQQVGTGGYYAYLGLYILGYIADDALMVTLAVIALGSKKLTENTGRWLKLLSGVVMLVLGLVMLLRPDWLR
jgi:glutaredoxin